MSIHASEIIISIINFVIFFLILRIFFFKKITNVMNERNRIIRDNIDKAIADREEAEKLLASAEATTKDSKEEGARIISEQKKKAELLYEDIVSDARNEAKLIILRGTTDADREREQARKELRKNVVDMASIMTEKVIGKIADEKTYDSLVDEVISQAGEK